MDIEPLQVHLSRNRATKVLVDPTLKNLRSGLLSALFSTNRHSKDASHSRSCLVIGSWFLEGCLAAGHSFPHMGISPNRAGFHAWVVRVGLGDK